LGDLEAEIGRAEASACRPPVIASTGSAALKTAALHSNLHHLPIFGIGSAKVRWRTEKLTSEGNFSCC
jgi:hypothetical protein